MMAANDNHDVSRNEDDYTSLITGLGVSNLYQGESPLDPSMLPRLGADDLEDERYSLRDDFRL